MTKLTLALCLLLLTAGLQAAELRERFPELVRADAAKGRSNTPAKGVRITYLGTHGYLLEARGAVILVDPYFSRMGLLRSALKGRTVARPDLINRWLAGVPRLDAILVTHGHIDHLFDVPYILGQRPSARLYASTTSVASARAAGIPRQQTRVVHPRTVLRVGSAMVRVQRATHDRVFGEIPFPGPARHTPPTHVDDWTCGEPLAYLVEISGQRIYLAAGSTAQDRPAGGLGHIDLLIQGLATPDAQKALPAILECLQPEYVLPSHMDNFFRPLNRGFSFLPLTDFPQARRTVARHGGKLILLDYFRPWTLH